MRCERLGLTKVIVTITILYNKDALIISYTQNWSQYNWNNVEKLSFWSREREYSLIVSITFLLLIRSKVAKFR